MKWQLSHGDILDVPADVLVCSANVFLALSGGVGGAFLLRYGDAMQAALNRYLTDRGLRSVGRGEVVEMPPCGSSYRAVLHAVAVDAFYNSSAEVVRSVIDDSLRRAAARSARRVALAAVGTGYGRLSMAEFARGLTPLLERAYPPVEEVVLCLRSWPDAEELAKLLPQLEWLGAR
ncbi:MAG TPA: macro domain-containing protein [Gemmataceae bacterium]|nr:macro domain-containing protein [Gemmataceae bacterium]